MLRLNVEIRFTDQIQRAKDFLGEQTCKQSNDITTLRENKKKDAYYLEEQNNVSGLWCKLSTVLKC